MATLLVLHGPNLNLLGSREPSVYGSTSLEAIDSMLKERAQAQGHQLSSLQSNAESKLIDHIHDAKKVGVNFILFNPGAFTHTSIALRDALSGVAIPFIELHISNVYGREAFRKISYFSDIAEGVICGFGSNSYRLALDAAVGILNNQPMT